MPRRTLQAQIIRGLERLGYRRNERYRVHRYTVFDALNRPGYYIYVGKMGAVRSGPNQANSIPLDGLKAKALAAGLPAKEPVA